MEIKIKNNLLFQIFVLIFFTFQTYDQCFALEKETHKVINQQIARTQMNNFSLNLYFIDQLGFKEGVEKVFDGKEVWRWVQDGGKTEDEPAYTRSRNHFHNPLLLWENAGLDSGIFTGQSSSLWLEDQSNRRMTDLGGDWSWEAARKFYYAALTGDSTALNGFKIEEWMFNSILISGKTNMNESERNKFFAWTFRALGQLAHLVEDSSVPSHTRNDVHILPEYEKFVDNIRKNNPSEFQNFLSNPVFYEGPVFNPASFIDADMYSETDPGITSLNIVGLSEFTNANFFSEDTAFSSSFPYPSWSTIIEYDEVIDANTGELRTYLMKTGEGEGILVRHLVAGGLFYRYLPQIIKNLAFSFDENVYKDYASHLLPRAVGYSASLLKYFFRGKLEVTSVSKNSIKIKNLSSEDMNGTFALYYDAISGERKPVSNASWSLSLRADDMSDQLDFLDPEDIAEKGKYILVFRGQMGEESNAVAGKVWTMDLARQMIYVKSIEASDPVFHFKSGDYCHGGIFDYLSIDPAVRGELLIPWGTVIYSYFKNLTFELGTVGIDPSEVSSVDFSGKAGMLGLGNPNYCSDKREKIFQKITIKIGSFNWSATSSEADYPGNIYEKNPAEIFISVNLNSGEQIIFQFSDNYSPQYGKLLELPTANPKTSCWNLEHIAVLESSFALPCDPCIIYEKGVVLTEDSKFEIGGYSRTESKYYETIPYNCLDDRGRVGSVLNVYTGEKLFVSEASIEKGITKTYRYFEEYPPDPLIYAPSIQMNGYIEKTTDEGEIVRTDYIVNSPY